MVKNSPAGTEALRSVICKGRIPKGIWASKGAGWRITESYYEEKRKEYRTKQKEINGKIAKLHIADEDYYLTSEYLLKLASNASKLFESSEVHEKRLLLKMALQNLELKGKIARFDWIKPFDQIAFYASRQSWLHRLDQVRKFYCS